MSSNVITVAVPKPLYQTFEYLLPATIAAESVQPGMRVEVPFGTRKLVGVVLAIGEPGSGGRGYKLKKVEQVLDDQPLLSEEILNLTQWAANYYHAPIGEVVVNTIPKRFRQSKFSNPIGNNAVAPEMSQFSNLKQHVLNPEQQQALESIQAKSGFQVNLLFGITGSGKTEVYLQAMQQVLAQQKQALILVPEIGLTPQIVARISQAYDLPMSVLHSGLTDRQRAEAWLSAVTGEAKIIVGTRSSIFTPLPDLSLIVIDEEHDLSFKQQSGFRYHARDVAIKRAKELDIPVILGSATPSLESYANAEQGRYQLLKLTERAGGAKTPLISLLNIQDQKLQSGLSELLLKTMQRHLDKEGQVLLFLNRRGFAPILMCHHCGWIKHCDRCDSPMTVHINQKLYCHQCDAIRPMPARCEECQGEELFTVGVGTEQLEETVTQLFPDKKVLRIDRDSTRKKGAMDEKLAAIHAGEADILIGTQMLTKGHHFANLTLVAVVNADNGLFSYDFRALEYLGQQIVQVAGRAGREDKSGEVVIQTHQPNHSLLNYLLQAGYEKFLQALLKERQAAILPPFSYQAALIAKAVSKSAVLAFLHEASDLLSASEQLEVFGPSLHNLKKIAGKFEGEILLQSTSRRVLQQVLHQWQAQLVTLKSATRVKWVFDVR